MVKLEKGIYGNDVHKHKLNQRKVWRVKRPQENHMDCNQLEQGVLATLKGETNDKFMEWLTKSVVCVSNEPWDLEVLSQALVKDGCEKVRALTKNKFILTYHTCLLYTSPSPRD